jgi:hypothetical protein
MLPLLGSSTSPHSTIIQLIHLRDTSSIMRGKKCKPKAVQSQHMQLHWVLVKAGRPDLGRSAALYKQDCMRMQQAMSLVVPAL